MNDIYTKDTQVLRLSMDHKNLCTEVTAEARHTQLSDISKHYIGAFKTTEIQRMKSQKEGFNK